MSWIDRLFGLETRAVTWDSFSSDVASVWGGSGITTSGERITEETSLQVSAVFASVRVISEPISTLPIDSFVKDEKNSDAPRAYKRPAWLDVPNAARPELTRIALVQQALWSLLLYGDAFIAVGRDDLGRVVTLDVLDPDAVVPDTYEGRRVYWVNGRPLGPDDVLHAPGFMLPGAIRGLSVIKKAAAETIGVAKAAQVFGAAFFGNGAHPGLVIEAPGPITKEGQTALKQAWNEIRQGAGNAHRIAVATEGAKFTKVTLDPDEAQFIETRQFSIADIARFFGVPPHLIADASSSTSWGSGLAEQNVAFAQNTLAPWVARLEEGFTRLFRSDLAVNRQAYIKVNMAAFVRGTLKERVEVYQAGILAGLWLVDECRAWEDLPPLPDGLGKIPRASKNLVVLSADPPAATGDSPEPDDTGPDPSEVAA